MSNTRGSIKGFFENLSERRDRRACTRSNSPRVTYIDLGDGNGGIALNISEGGLAITAAGMFFADYFPSIRFQLPEVPSWIETSGRVVWVGDSKKAAGISFENITEVDRERIRHWISSQVPADDRIEQGIGYLAKNNKQLLENSAPGGRRNLTTSRKLEVLSEADEARFAAMFPSESTLHLQTPNAPNWTETDVEREVQERVGQNPGEFLEDIPTPHSVREGFGAKPASESSMENMEAIPPGFGEESELGSGDAGAASDARAPASESVDTVVFPRRRWIIDRSDNARKTEDEAMREYAVTQFEAPDSSLDQNPRFPDGDRSAGLSLSEPEESPVIQESPKESIPAEEKTPGECALPTFTYPPETDWRQQFNWSRGPTATQLISRQVAEGVPERSNLPRIAALGILIAAICFAAGLMLGTGSMRRLLRFNGEFPHSSSDVSPGTSSGNSNQIVERAPEPQSSNSSSDVPTNTSTSDSPGTSHGARSVQPPKGPRTYPSETPNTGNDLKAPANNAVQDTESEDAPSKASSSSALRSDNSEDRKPGLPPSGPVVPETRARPARPANGKPPGDYEATVDKPYSEVRRPILVTPPDEKSGPFRLAFPEVAVSASGALAISAQRFVLVPTLPGPASAHRPARLQAGVLIYHVDPVPPAGSGDIGGTVKVRATIGKGGDVLDVTAISGPASLIPRVVRAVREWRYTVTLLDGQPLGAEEDVVVEFRPRR